MISKTLAAVLITASLLGPGYIIGYDPAQFRLPEDAKVLVVVEGNADKTCVVTAFEKNVQNNSWETVFAVDGNVGRGGMNKNRVRNDGSTPVGVWMLNTPFGQKPKQEGFPSDYVQVGADHVWTDDTNRLVKDTTGKIAGERVGAQNYAGYYDYVLDAGFNRNAVTGKGSALFIHCQGASAGTSAGCVKIPTEAMEALMKLYGKYGEGRCFIAQGIKGEIDRLYDKYGTNNGLEAQY